MRCLGRLISLCLLLLLLGLGWLYRGDIERRIRDFIDPMSAARRVGVPSTAAGAAAESKLAGLSARGVDSVVLNPSEMGALVLAGLGWQAADWADSLRVELGDRSFSVSGRVATVRMTAPLRRIIDLPLGATEIVTLAGSLTPARVGMAEWRIERATIRGVPLPAGLVGRILGELGIPAGDGRLQIPLPSGAGGFRVRPDGAAFYYGARP